MTVRTVWRIHIVLLFIIVAAGVQAAAHPSSDSPQEETGFWKRLKESDRFDFGGHLKNRFQASWLDSESPFQLGGADPLLDYSAELRLKARWKITNWAEFNVHDESFFIHSDTLHAENVLKERFGPLFPEVYDSFASFNDDRRLMDLSWTMDEGNRHTALTRLDRLYVSFFSSRGSLKIGRQAITWGNGFIFNPMDVFSPFAPTAIDRDYKPGEDAVLADYTFSDPDIDTSLLYVARKDPETGNMEWDQASLAAKLRWSVPNTQTELTLGLGKHFQDTIVAAGTVGYIGGAAWRSDVTWTYLDNNGGSYLSAVFNVDYAWTWWGRNFYGWVEYYFNGLGNGRKNYSSILDRDPIRLRLERGELFVLGQHYADTHLQCEVHPLVNLHFITITNMLDPSGILQPYIVWDVTSNIQLNLAATLFWGERNTEYGGVEIPFTSFVDARSNTVSAWINWYF